MTTLTYENAKAGLLVKWPSPFSNEWAVGVVVEVIGEVADGDYPCDRGVEILFDGRSVIVDLYYNKRIFLLEEE